MEILHVAGKRHEVPSTWNELNRAQLLLLVRVLYGSESHWPLKLRLLSALSGVPQAQLLSLPASVTVQLYPLTDFIFSEDHRLTEQLLPEVRLPLPRHATRWVGPRGSFRNLLFGEFIFADTYFRLYATRRSAAALDLLVATLYRPLVRNMSPGHPNWQGDRRVAFNEHRIEFYAQTLQHLPDEQKLAIVTWYRGCRAQLEGEFPEIFEAVEDDRRTHRGAEQTGDWTRVLRKLSGGAFGPLEQTARQHARTVLAELQDVAREAHHAKKTA